MFRYKSTMGYNIHIAPEKLIYVEVEVNINLDSQKGKAASELSFTAFLVLCMHNFANRASTGYG